MNYNNLAGRSIHSVDAVDWEFLSNKGLTQSFFGSINTDPFSGSQWANFFQINEPIFRELTREFFASFEFDATPCRYDPLHKDVTFRLGGVEREMPLLEFEWRVGLYYERESRDVLVAQSIRNPRVKLAHWCIMMTITGRKETTNRVTEIDLFFLYCIFGEGVVCNIPYWLTKYLKSVRDKSVIFRGMFVMKIARSYGLLTNEMEKVKVIMKEAMEKGGNEGVGGSADIYCHMSQGDWQVRQARWMDQQDEHWVRIDAWMECHTP
ncbi:hypothetical protein Tco_0174835 [Tanacetum coccineum]